jgi:hypothetical protein
MSGAPKILLATLWQRTSERGNEYLSGFLGKARVIGFRGDPTTDGIPTLNLYLTPGKEQEEGTRSAPGRSARARRPQQERSAGDDRPFFDDPVDDMGRRQ